MPVSHKLHSGQYSERVFDQYIQILRIKRMNRFNIFYEKIYQLVMVLNQVLSGMKFSLGIPTAAVF